MFGKKKDGFFVSTLKTVGSAVGGTVEFLATASAEAEKRSRKVEALKAAYRTAQMRAYEKHVEDLRALGVYVPYADQSAERARISAL